MSNESEPLTPMKLRERAGVTQRQVAIALDKTTTTVSHWETRRKSPELHPSEVLQLQRLYQCTIDDLLEAFGGMQVKLSLIEFKRLLEHCQCDLAQVVEAMQRGSTNGR